LLLIIKVLPGTATADFEMLASRLKTKLGSLDDFQDPSLVVAGLAAGDFRQYGLPGEAGVKENDFPLTMGHRLAVESQIFHEQSVFHSNNLRSFSQEV
jgi:hypothetical protein